MNKSLIIFALLVVVLAYSEATTRPQCRAICRKNQHSAVKCVRDGHGCRKMKQCSIEEENCRRRLVNRKPLKTTKSTHCRYIKTALGAGRCAPRQNYRLARNVRPDCRRMRCTEPSKKLNCYRSRQNQCQLLTACQLSRINCSRGRNNALSWTDDRQCKGMRNGQALQKCRRVPQRG